MPKRKKSNGRGLDVRFIFIISLLVVIAFAFMYLGINLGFNVSSVSDYFGILPFLFLFIVGLFVIVNITGYFMLPAMGLIGFSVAGMLNEMFNLGMVPPELLTGLTIDQAMFWVVVISLLFGGILVVLTSKRRR